MIWTWHLDPVAFPVFGLDVRWYGLCYLLGFFLCLHLGYKILKITHQSSPIMKQVSKNKYEDLIFGAFLFGVLGGRLGEFLFYSPSIFWTNPFEIFKIWHGGMSIHGGILGAVAFLFVWTRKMKTPFLLITDSIAIPLALALGFGRLANFINGELVGIPTDQSWGVIFPHVDELARHPSQLYEMGKNFLLAGVLFWIWEKNLAKQTGFLSAFFLIGYGILRFGIEFFREPDGMVGMLSTGQVLCFVMILFGGLFCFFIQKHKK